MSIATQIERLQNAKQDIKIAIENKGVSVGDGLLDTYADKINQIESGSNIKITNAAYLFYQGARLEYMDEFMSVCENVTNTQNMFQQCTTLKSIDLSNFNISNSKSISYMFYLCSALEELEINGILTLNVTNVAYCFGGCKKLAKLPMLDFSKVTAVSNAFNNCTALTDCGGFLNLGKAYTSKATNYSSYALNLSTCTSLTHDSLMNVINNLYDLNLTYKVASGGTLYTQKLQLGDTNVAKLTADEILIATNKGWTVS